VNTFSTNAGGDYDVKTVKACHQDEGLESGKPIVFDYINSTALLNRPDDAPEFSELFDSVCQHCREYARARLEKEERCPAG